MAKNKCSKIGKRTAIKLGYEFLRNFSYDRGVKTLKIDDYTTPEENHRLLEHIKEVVDALDAIQGCEFCYLSIIMRDAINYNQWYLSFDFIPNDPSFFNVILNADSSISMNVDRTSGQISNLRFLLGI